MKAPHLRPVLLAALTSAVFGLALAQTPAPAPAPAPASAIAAAADALPIPDAPEVVGSAWLVMDAATGQIIAGRNIDARVEPASITKVMTSYVIAAELAAGRIQPDDQVLMSENAWRKGGAATDGSYSGFPVNQHAPLSEMEIAMVVQSGNDASIALAEHIAGSEDAFAQLMNAHAERLGMTGTHFSNASGLSAPDHYSTARDLALLGRAMARDYPAAYAHNKIKEFTVGPITQHNRNRLLWRDDSIDGIKTGHHSGAGYCLMASALRGSQRLISVVMGSTSESQRTSDSLALLNWGFRFYQTHELYAANAVISTQAVWKGAQDSLDLGVGEPLLVSIPRGRQPHLSLTVDIPEQLLAPIVKGQPIGTVKIILDEHIITEQPLIALEDIEEGGFFKRLWDEIRMWWAS